MKFIQSERIQTKFKLIFRSYLFFKEKKITLYCHFKNCKIVTTVLCEQQKTEKLNSK